MIFTKNPKQIPIILNKQFSWQFLLKTQQSVKIYFANGNIRRFAVDSLSTLKEETKLSQTQHFEYQDDESDYVLLQNELDWSECLKLKIPLLKIRVIEKCSKKIKIFDEENLEVKKVEDFKKEKKEKVFPGRMMILKSYGFEEDLSRSLLIKYNGNLFKVLSEYHAIKKPKDHKIIFSEGKKVEIFLKDEKKKKKILDVLRIKKKNFQRKWRF